MIHCISCLTFLLHPTEQFLLKVIKYVTYELAITVDVDVHSYRGGGRGRHVLKSSQVKVNIHVNNHQ